MPPSGTRDFLGDDARRRDRLFGLIRDVYERHGFEPLMTPAFENLDVLTGKYGDEAGKLIFKILRRGEHESTGQADLALRYDLTVPLARVIATHGDKLPSPYKRYAIGPVWRADRPGRGRFREFTQCDIDIVGSASPLADAEVLCAVGAALDTLGVKDWTVHVNSRVALEALLEAHQVPADIGPQVLTTLDKLDKLEPAKVVVELRERGLDDAAAAALVDDLSAPDAVQRTRTALSQLASGREGLAQVDRLIELAQLGGRVRYSPQLVRGLDYYTGTIFEVTADGFPGSIASGGRYDGLVAALGGPDTPACGGSVGLERILSSLPDDSGASARRLDVALTVLDDGGLAVLSRLSGKLRAAGVSVEPYLGGSGKLAKQLKWASSQQANIAVIYGPDERSSGELIVRNMDGGTQSGVTVDEAPAHIMSLLRERPE